MSRKNIKSLQQKTYDWALLLKFIGRYSNVSSKIFVQSYYILLNLLFYCLAEAACSISRGLFWRGIKNSWKWVMCWGHALEKINNFLSPQTPSSCKISHICHAGLLCAHYLLQAFSDLAYKNMGSLLRAFMWNFDGRIFSSIFCQKHSTVEFWHEGSQWIIGYRQLPYSLVVWQTVSRPGLENSSSKADLGSSSTR